MGRSASRSVTSLAHEPSGSRQLTRAPTSVHYPVPTALMVAVRNHAMSVAKIVSLHDLAQGLEASRRAGLKIVHCHGCFDLMHIGHIRHLQAARAMGDLLVVTVTADDHVAKGEGRPLHRGPAGRGAGRAGLRRPRGRQSLAHGGRSDPRAQAGLLRQGSGRGRSPLGAASASSRRSRRSASWAATCVSPTRPVLLHGAAERAIPRARRPGSA